MSTYYRAELEFEGRYIQGFLHAELDGPLGVHEFPRQAYTVNLIPNPDGTSAVAIFPHLNTSPQGKGRFEWQLRVFDASTGREAFTEVITQNDVVEADHIRFENERPLSVAISGIQEQLDFLSGNAAGFITKIGEAVRDKVDSSTTEITGTLTANTESMVKAFQDSATRLGVDEQQRAEVNKQVAEHLGRMAESLNRLVAHNEIMDRRISAIEEINGELAGMFRELATRQEELAGNLVVVDEVVSGIAEQRRQSTRKDK
jgi:hypothetical protein